MKPTNSLVLVVTLALGATTIGCGTDPSAAGDDDDGGGIVDPSKPLDATGTFAVHSTFDLAANMPGTAGTVVNTIIAATDDGDDPTRWIVEQLIAQLPASVQGPADLAADLAVQYLNDQLLHRAPALLQTLIAVGHDFGTIAKQFGLNETLVLTRSGDGYTAVHTVTGVHFNFGTQDTDYALATYNLPTVAVSNIAVTMDATGQLTIAPHNIPLAYGQILRMGLDAAIIPLIDPSAHNLNDLLAHKINCQAVGTVVSDAVFDFSGLRVSATTFQNACTKGLMEGAKLIYAKIDAVASTALQFGLNGTAKGIDKNRDRTIDTIQTGTWAGTLSYGGSPAPLSPATFFGERM